MQGHYNIGLGLVVMVINFLVVVGNFVLLLRVRRLNNDCKKHLNRAKAYWNMTMKLIDEHDKKGRGY